MTVAPQSKARIVFAHSNIGVVGSNLTEGMDVYVCFLVCVVLGVGSNLATD
jgi:hypothetical protein